MYKPGRWQVLCTSCSTLEQYRWKRESLFVSLPKILEVDWSTQSIKNWVTKYQRLYNENVIVSHREQISVVFNIYSKSTPDKLLALNFGTESADATYNFITLIKTLWAIYSSVNHAVLAQKELGPGLKQGGRESVVCILGIIQETFSQANCPAVG